MYKFANSTPGRLLLIAYGFPPVISPQSLRWYYIVKHLASRGYRIDILTIRMPRAFYEDIYALPDRVQIWSTFPGFFNAMTYLHSREKAAGKIVPAEKPRISRGWQLAEKLHSLAYKLLNASMIPDIYAEWLPFAVHGGLHLLAKHRYDAIISSSEPRIDHLVGYILTRRSGTFWVADYGDPWIYPIPIHFEPVWKRKLLSEIEELILPRTGAITLTSRGTKDLYLERYPFLNEKDLYVVPQACEPDDLNHFQANASDVFRIVYCGSFYKTIRDPSLFLEALAEIDNKDIEVVIAGRNNEFAHALHSKSNIRYLGFMPHHEVLALEKGASVLLHLGNAIDIQVPGKFYEYIGAKRPILAIKNSQNDPSAYIIERYNKGLVVRNTKADIKAGILQLYTMWQHGALDTSFDLERVHDFSWAKRAEQFIEILETF